MTRVIGLAALAVFVVSQVADAGITARLVAVYGEKAETNPHALQTLASQRLGPLLLLKAGFTVFLVAFCSAAWLIGWAFGSHPTSPYPNMRTHARIGNCFFKTSSKPCHFDPEPSRGGEI